ncbi:MAG: hypothetical protein ACRD6W_03620 [Nitrososphaerales archaeon]
MGANLLPHRAPALAAPVPAQQAIGAAACGPDFRLGQDAMVLECIHFHSATGEGTRGSRSNPAWEHELKFTCQMLLDIQPKVVVTVGKDPPRSGL